MPSLCVVGAQWGDEGKGKLVDYLTSNADWVVRFQGGNNAGHTLVVDGVKTKLSLVPSGILRPKAVCLVGAGVVLNPRVFLDEIAGLRQAGVDVNPKRLVVDRDAHLILDYHMALDQAREEAKGKNKIGTTGRGIGPAYEDRAARCGVRLAELFALNELKPKLEEIVQQRNLYLREVLKSSLEVRFDEVWRTVTDAAERIGPFVGNTSLILHGALKREEKVVFEGAQGSLLDINFGTIPFVTSSNTLSGAVATGCGVGPNSVGYILGVAKAYATRVGAGPFPTELEDETGNYLREKGAEFGTVTGRPRRCGWMDAFALKRAVRLNGLDSLAITKLDVLSGLKKIKVCIKYKMDGVELDDVPSLVSEYARVEPEYVEFDGWSEPLTNVTKWHKLPAQTRLYLSTLSEIVGVPISIASVGPDRKSTLFSSGASYVKNFLD